MQPTLTVRAHALLFSLALMLTCGFATAEPLQSWNPGPAKQAILNFVKQTTDQASPQFVPPAERIATFDQDGTLWVEQPMYSQVMYVLESVPALLKAKPELAKVAPFSTVMEVLKGDHAAMKKLTEEDLLKQVAATSTGISEESFSADAKKWIAAAKDPRWKRPYTELTYLPMQELLAYLRVSGYKTYMSPVAVKILCVPMLKKPTACHLNRSSVLRLTPSTPTLSTASRY